MQLWRLLCEVSRTSTCGHMVWLFVLYRRRRYRGAKCSQCLKLGYHDPRCISTASWCMSATLNVLEYYE